MTKLTRDEVLHLARLSRLAITEDEISDYLPKMEAHLDFGKQLMELDTHDVSPTTHPFPLENVFREDRVTTESAEVLAAAPSVEDHMFRVPRII